LDRLLSPAVLALLAREQAHGYEFIRQLKGLDMFAEVLPDISGVFKALKSMEEEGLIPSNCEFGDIGPAKRPYSMTKNNEAHPGSII
jgi:PadR family transcriptional regulator, regulatory protein PadR